MLQEMKVNAHLKPGQNGTRRLTEQYGDRLLCVRYRFDELRGVKLKTVELIVDERPPGQAALQGRRPGAAQRGLLLRRLRVKWDPQRKHWLATYGLVRGTVLEERIAAR